MVVYCSFFLITLCLYISLSYKNYTKYRLFASELLHPELLYLFGGSCCIQLQCWSESGTGRFGKELKDSVKRHAYIVLLAFISGDEAVLLFGPEQFVSRSLFLLRQIWLYSSPSPTSLIGLTSFALSPDRCTLYINAHKCNPSIFYNYS